MLCLLLFSLVKQEEKFLKHIYPYNYDDFKNTEVVRNIYLSENSELQETTFKVEPLHSPSKASQYVIVQPLHRFGIFVEPSITVSLNDYSFQPEYSVVEKVSPKDCSSAVSCRFNMFVVELPAFLGAKEFVLRFSQRIGRPFAVLHNDVSPTVFSTNLAECIRTLNPESLAEFSRYWDPLGDFFNQNELPYTQLFYREFQHWPTPYWTGATTTNIHYGNSTHTLVAHSGEEKPDFPVALHPDVGQLVYGPFWGLRLAQELVELVFHSYSPLPVVKDFRRVSELTSPRTAFYFRNAQTDFALNDSFFTQDHFLFENAAAGDGAFFYKHFRFYKLRLSAVSNPKKTPGSRARYFWKDSVLMVRFEKPVAPESEVSFGYSFAAGSGLEWLPRTENTFFDQTTWEIRLPLCTAPVDVQFNKQGVNYELKTKKVYGFPLRKVLLLRKSVVTSADEQLTVRRLVLCPDLAVLTKAVLNACIVVAIHLLVVN